MADNQVDGSTADSKESGAFEKLETAADHDDRAERLRAEAKRDVLDTVADTLPFDAEVTVKLKSGAFEVTCAPQDLPESIGEKFNEDVHTQSVLKFEIGERKLSGPNRLENIKEVIADIEAEYEDGAPVDVVLERAEEYGMDPSQTEHEIDKLKQKGEVYEPSTDTLRTT